MLYFLISFVLFFTSAQSNGDIKPFYSYFTRELGEFKDNSEAITVLSNRISSEYSRNSIYYRAIPEKMRALGFSSDNTSEFEKLMLEVLALAARCHVDNKKLIASHIFSEEDLDINRNNFLFVLNKLYLHLHISFYQDCAYLKIDTGNKTDIEVFELLINFVLENNINMLPPEN